MKSPGDVGLSLGTSDTVTVVPHTGGLQCAWYRVTLACVPCRAAAVWHHKYSNPRGRWPCLPQPCRPGYVWTICGFSVRLFVSSAHGWTRASVVVESFMVMLCYKNGSLTREAVRDRVCGGTWDGMADLVSKSTPGNSGYVGFFVTQVRTWLELYGRRACRDDDNGMCGCVPSPRSLHTSQPPARTCSLRLVNL